MSRLAATLLMSLSLGAFAAGEPEFKLTIENHKFAPDRIETITARDKAQELGTKAQGSVDASTTDVLSAMAALVASVPSDPFMGTAD